MKKKMDTRKVTKKRLFGYRSMAILLAVIMVAVSPLISLKGIGGGNYAHAEENAATIIQQDGTYSVSGDLWHATSDQASMGNAAIKQPMTVIVKDGKARIEFESVPLSTNFGKVKFTGYLGGLQYYGEYFGSKVPGSSIKSAPVPVLEYYDVKDRYNDAASGTDPNMKGKKYPHYYSMPVSSQKDFYWIKVYVPVMEEISGYTGGGSQFAKLRVNWSTLTRISDDTESIAGKGGNAENLDPNLQAGGGAGDQSKDNSTQKSKTTADKSKNKKNSSASKKLNIKKLEDGVYVITGNMVKIDRQTASMSDAAIGHNVKLTVKNGKYTLSLTFAGLNVGSQKGYLGKLWYFKTGYKADANGTPTGKRGLAQIDKYQTAGGSKLSDSFGTDYPKTVSFPMIEEAKKDGYVPLQVFVPVMEAISAGTGTQPVYLKLDLSSIKKAENDSVFEKNMGSGTSDDPTQSSSGAPAGGSTLAGSSLSPSSGASLESGNSIGGGNSDLQASLGTSSLTEADADQVSGDHVSPADTDEEEKVPPMRKHALPAGGSVLGLGAGALAYRRRKNIMGIFSH